MEIVLFQSELHLQMENCPLLCLIAGVHILLVGGFNPLEKYIYNICLIGSFPQVGVKQEMFETTT